MMAGRVRRKFKSHWIDFDDPRGLQEQVQSPEAFKRGGGGKLVSLKLLVELGPRSQSEVDFYLIVFRNQNILRFEATMNKVLLVQGLNRFCNFYKKFQNSSCDRAFANS